MIPASLFISTSARRQLAATRKGRWRASVPSYRSAQRFHHSRAADFVFFYARRILRCAGKTRSKQSEEVVCRSLTIHRERRCFMARVNVCLSVTTTARANESCTGAFLDRRVNFHIPPRIEYHEDDTSITSYDNRIIRASLAEVSLSLPSGIDIAANRSYAKEGGGGKDKRRRDSEESRSKGPPRAGPALRVVLRYASRRPHPFCTHPPSSSFALLLFFFSPALSPLLDGHKSR